MGFCLETECFLYLFVFLKGPNILKKNAGSSGREGEKSAKSEDDVFSDAVTDFSDSGISPRLDERFESVEELGKSLEPKSVEGDLHGSGAVEAEESAGKAYKRLYYMFYAGIESFVDYNNKLNWQLSLTLLNGNLFWTF